MTQSCIIQASPDIAGILRPLASDERSQHPDAASRYRDQSGFLFAVGRRTFDHRRLDEGGASGQK